MSKKILWSSKWQIIKTLVVDFNLDVLQAEYRGKKVAVKSLLDDSHAAQTFLAEASIMTYVWISLLTVTCSDVLRYILDHSVYTVQNKGWQWISFLLLFEYPSARTVIAILQQQQHLLFIVHFFDKNNQKCITKSSVWQASLSDRTFPYHQAQNSESQRIDVSSLIL